MYWPYFNRVMTYETDRANVEYNFGSCNHTCPADYVDSAYEIVRGGGWERRTGTWGLPSREHIHRTPTCLLTIEITVVGSQIYRMNEYE